MRTFIKNFLCIGFLIQSTSNHCMFTALRNRELTTAARPAYNRVGYNRLQQRRYWQPVHVKKNHVVQKTDYPNQNFFAQGAAVVNSTHWLPNVWAHRIDKHELNTSDFMAKFANALFQISSDGHISIAHNKNTLSYALTLEFFGVLRGAQEKGLLTEPSVVNKIVAFGQAEYAKTMGNNEESPELQGEIRSFIAAMNEVNKEDSNIAQSLQDAYLFLRMDQSNSHDMIHYLLGFNRYAGILSDQRLKEFKDILAQQNQVVHLSDLDYNQADRENFIEELLKIKMPSDQIKYARDNFALAVHAMMHEKRNKKLYSPKVIMDQVSYKGQPAFSTCGETAFADFLGNLVFDEELQVFDPSRFFPGLKINNDVIQFFNKYHTVNTVNDKDAQKDFVKLVSGVDGVIYVKNGYEISSIANEQNLIALCNKFFSIQANSLSDLGEMLSNEKRSITFELILGRDNSKKIAITIHDKKTDKTKYMYLNFVPGHTNFEVGKENSNKVFLDPKILLAEYNNPESMFLLYLHEQPEIVQLFFRKMKNNGNTLDASVYYAFPTQNDYEKSRLIRAILLYSKDKQAIDYARFLFDSLSDHSKDLLKDAVPSLDVFMQKFSEQQTLKE